MGNLSPPLPGLKRLETKKSSSIDAVAYEQSSYTLLIRFKNSNDTYLYRDVSPSVVQDFLSSPSLGSAFDSKIKNAGYTWSRLDDDPIGVLDLAQAAARANFNPAALLAGCPLGMYAW